MNNQSSIKPLISFSLPKNSLFDEENFAGDPDIKLLYDLIKKQFKLDLRVFVSWACPIDVTILQLDNTQVLIRSERLDTMLIEYVHLREAVVKEYNSYIVNDGLLSTSILRWMTELLISFKKPHHALMTSGLSFSESTFRMKIRPFRDECLASLELPSRIALQSFSLLHEVGHILYPKKDNSTLDSEIDGIKISRHIERDLNEANTPKEVCQYYMDEYFNHVDYNNLISEIEADSFAFKAVVKFIIGKYGLSTREAIYAALIAFEATLFINSCKHNCYLLNLNAEGQLDEKDYESEDFINGILLSIRARCVLRIAAFVWAETDNPGIQLKSEVYNSFVPLVDELFIPYQKFMFDATSKIVRYSHLILKRFNEIHENDRTVEFEKMMTNLEKDQKQNLDLFYILIAFGLPGGTNVKQYLKSIY